MSGYVIDTDVVSATESADVVKRPCSARYATALPATTVFPLMISEMSVSSSCLLFDRSHSGRAAGFVND